MKLSAIQIPLWQLIVVLILIAGGIWLFVPSFPRPEHGPHGRSYRLVCAVNLREIRAAVHAYHEEHGNEYPHTLAVLAKTGSEYVTEKDLKCPAVEDGGEYFYLRPQLDDKGESNADAIMACEFEGNHKEGRNVLFVNGEVRLVTEELFQSELAKPDNVAFAAALRDAAREALEKIRGKANATQPGG